MYFAVGLLALAVGAVVFLGWLVLLVIGIVRWRRRATAGIALTIIGAIWGFGAIAVGGLGALAYRQFSRAIRVENFDPAGYKGEMGTIVLPYKGESSLVLMSQVGAKSIRVRAKDGVAQAPAGKYYLSSYEAVAKDQQRARWTASCFPGRQAMGSRSLSLGAASPQQLDLGPPFTASVVVRNATGAKPILDLSITGRGGNSYTIFRGDGRPPSFQVVSRDAQVLWQGRFEYG